MLGSKWRRNKKHVKDQIEKEAVQYDTIMTIIKENNAKRFGDDPDRLVTDSTGSVTRTAFE